MNEILRRHLYRIFNGHDPMNHIEDIRMDTDPESTFCVVRFKVPQVPTYFGPALKMYGIYPDPLADQLRIMTDLAVQAAVMGEWKSRGVQKAPEKEPPKPAAKKIDPMDTLKPERILYSGPKTIVFWPDGTKTMVSRMEGQEQDEYYAFCAAVVKKMFGATHKAKKFLESIKVVQEPKVKKFPKAPWRHMETMPMPGTEDPDWGKKHWGSEEEESCNG